MENIQVFGKVKNDSGIILNEESIHYIEEMIKKANFDGDVFFTKDDGEFYGAYINYDKNEIVVTMKEANNDDSNPYKEPVNLAITKLAHELGHYVDKDRTYGKELQIMDEIYETEVITDEKMNEWEESLKRNILLSELAAFENGKEFLPDNNNLSFLYEMGNILSFEQYRNGSSTASAKYIIQSAIESRNAENGLGSNDLYWHFAHNNIARQEAIGMERIPDMKQVTAPVFFDVKERDTGMVNELKKSVNKKIATIYHPYEKLPVHLKAERRLEAMEKGLIVLFPKKDDNLILHKLENMKEIARERTIVITERIKENKKMIDKIKGFGVKVADSMKKAVEFIHDFSQHYINDGLKESIAKNDTEKAKSFLMNGAVADTETKLRIIENKDMKQNLIDFLKPKKEKNQDRDLDL